VERFERTVCQPEALVETTSILIRRTETVCRKGWKHRGKNTEATSKPLNSAYKKRAGIGLGFVIAGMTF